MATNYTVQEKDTVAGRLKDFTSFSNPLARQTGSVANRIAASKGMTRSSIAVGEGLGAVMAQAVDVAKTDSTNIINTGNQNAINDTNIRNTDANNSSSERVATLQTDTQKQVQAAEAASRRQDLAAQLESQERIAGKEVALREKISDADRAVERERIAASTLVSQSDILSRERVAAADVLAKERQAQFQRENEILITNLNNTNQLRVEQIRLAFQENAGRKDEMGSAWAQYQAGLASIDPNATSASQNTMFARITEAFEARMAFINGSSYSLASSLTPSSIDQIIANQNKPVYTGGTGGGGTGGTGTGGTGTGTGGTGTGGTGGTSTPPPSNTPPPSQTNQAQQNFLATMNGVAPLLQGTGGQGAQVQATIAALVSQGKQAGYSAQDIASLATQVWPGTTVGQALSLISPHY